MKAMFLRSFTALALAFTLVPAQSLAQDESQAKDWGLTNAELARIDGRIVDVLCEIGGDCPDNCGDGGRQLGIVDGSGKLHLASKNGQASFNGAIEDLLPYCGKDVEADGVLAGHTGVTFYQVQFIREAGSAEWNKTNLWTKNWNAAHPDLKSVKGPWFRKDPRVIGNIEERGYFGLGDEVDQAYIDEWK